MWDISSSDATQQKKDSAASLLCEQMETLSENEISVLWEECKEIPTVYNGIIDEANKELTPYGLSIKINEFDETVLDDIYDLAKQKMERSEVEKWRKEHRGTLEALFFDWQYAAVQQPENVNTTVEEVAEFLIRSTSPENDIQKNLEILQNWQETANSSIEEYNEILNKYRMFFNSEELRPDGQKEPFFKDIEEKIASEYKNDIVEYFEKFQSDKAKQTIQTLKSEAKSTPIQKILYELGNIYDKRLEILALNGDMTRLPLLAQKVHELAQLNPDDELCRIFSDKKIMTISCAKLWNDYIQKKDLLHYDISNFNCPMKCIPEWSMTGKQSLSAYYLPDVQFLKDLRLAFFAVMATEMSQHEYDGLNYVINDNMKKKKSYYASFETAPGNERVEHVAIKDDALVVCAYHCTFGKKMAERIQNENVQTICNDPLAWYLNVAAIITEIIQDPELDSPYKTFLLHRIFAAMREWEVYENLFNASSCIKRLEGAVTNPKAFESADTFFTHEDRRQANQFIAQFSASMFSPETIARRYSSFHVDFDPEGTYEWIGFLTSAGEKQLTQTGDSGTVYTFGTNPLNPRFEEIGTLENGDFNIRVEEPVFYGKPVFLRKSGTAQIRESQMMTVLTQTLK